jgi:hypothetical protein
LTVPAGGTASTTVTADTRLDVPDGTIGAYLVATAAGGVRVETPLGVDKEVESYDVTVEITNRDGTPSTDHLVSLASLDGSFNYFDVYEPVGTQKIRVPKGEYGLFSWIFEGETTSSMLTDSKLVIDHPLTIKADARIAKPVQVTVPKEGARAVLAAVNAEWTSADFGIGASLLAADFGTLYAAPMSATTNPIFLGSVNGSFAEPGPAENFRNSPYEFDLAYFSQGRMFDGLHKAPRLKDLATIRTTFASPATGAQGAKANFAQYSENSGGWSVFVPFDLPFHRTEYVSTEAPVSGDFLTELPPVGDGFPETLSEHFAGRQQFRAGKTYTQGWNQAAFGPNVTQPSWAGDWASRQGDHIGAYVPMFGDGAGHPGFSTTDTDTQSLFQGNTKIGDGYEFDVPPGPATYRLDRTSTRSTPHNFSTSVSASWTFRSGHVAGEDFQRLPLSSVRFSPKLDDLNRAPGGCRFEIPVTVEHQPDSSAGTARKVTVDVSYDDGRTWRKATLRGSGDHRVATVDHPSKGGFVSLRTSATDSRGNKVTETLIRAYALR